MSKEWSATETEVKNPTLEPEGSGTPPAAAVERNCHPPMGNCGAQTVADINRAYVATPDWKI